MKLPVPDFLDTPVALRWRARASAFSHEWRTDRVPDLAAEVAFFAILSLFPAFLALASILGILGSIVGDSVATDVENTVLDFLGRILTDDASGTVEAVRSLFDQSSPGLLTFSLLAAIWTLSRGFASLVRALDVAYDLDEHRSWLRIRGTALTLSVGSIVAGAVMLAMLIVGPLFGSGSDIADEIGLGDAFVTFWDVVRLPLAVVVLMLWSATIFHIAPDHHTPWKWDVPGAVVTTALWLAFSFGLRLYLDLTGSGNQIVSVVGGILTVLLWFWLLSLAVLIGGEVNQIMLDERRALSD